MVPNVDPHDRGSTTCGSRYHSSETNHHRTRVFSHLVNKRFSCPLSSPSRTPDSTLVLDLDLDLDFGSSSPAAVVQDLGEQRGAHGSSQHVAPDHGRAASLVQGGEDAHQGTPEVCCGGDDAELPCPLILHAPTRRYTDSFARQLKSARCPYCATLPCGARRVDYMGSNLKSICMKTKAECLLEEKLGKRFARQAECS